MDATKTVYLAAKGYETQLAEELFRAHLPLLWQRGGLFGTASSAVPLAWAQNTWFSPVFIPIVSIGDGAEKLRSLQRNWACTPHDFFRRAALVQAKLPAIGKKPFVFGSSPPESPMGGWTLWDKDTVLASADTANPFPGGRIDFAENTKQPPNRAYLKLWEVFTLSGKRPAPGELCLDLGSSPGGWTWVLASLGAKVFSVDKAELAPQIAIMPGVHHCAGCSAFSLEPENAGKVDWLFWDVACYPSRLWTMIKRWLEKGSCRNFVCTLKFQHKTDFETMDRFVAVPGSRLIHLSHNKHELTWLRLT